MASVISTHTHDNDVIFTEDSLKEFIFHNYM